MSKLAQLRSLREAKFAKSQRKPKVERAGIAKALAAKPPQPEALSTPLSTSNAERQTKWRDANRDTHRERSRNSMRQLRKKRASSNASP